MRLPRLTTRRLLALAAVVALLEGERLSRWRVDFLMRAEVDADRANDFVDGPGPCLREEYDTPAMRMKLHAYWVASARKYRRAARYPWLSVPPDTPLPE